MIKYFLLFLVSVSISFSQVSVNPTRPSAADNAFTTAKGYTELEFGFSSTKDNWNLPFLLKAGLTENLEAAYLMDGLLNSYSSTEFGNPGLQLKYHFYQEERLNIAVAGKTLFLKNSDPSFAFYFAPSITTNSFQIDGTFGISSSDNGIEYNSSFIHAVSFSPSIDNNFGAFVEIFGEMKTNYNPLFIDGGISYKFSNSFVVDGAVAIGLNDDAGKSTTFQIGFTTLLIKLY